MNFVVEGHQMYYSQRLANIVGIEEAAILQQLHYRLQHQGKKKEGHFWYCQTHHQWTKQHTYWNAAKIGRLLLKLEQRKLIISTRKFNRFSTDRSKWYRIDYTQLQKLLDADETKKNELTMQGSLPIDASQNDKKQARQEAVSDVIHYLNKKAHKNFNDQAPANYRLVNTILNLGYTVEECYTVIDEQVNCWREDVQMQKYLRPMTLFRPVNFESYLNNAHARKAPLEYVPKPVVLDYEAGETF